MAWVSGKPTQCLWSECGSADLTTIRESFDAIDRVYVGAVRCANGHESLYSRRDDTMAKKTKRRRASKADRKLTKPDKPASRAVATASRGRPRQQDLPGTEDRAIQPLEDIAASYADVRDRRIELNREEGELKAHALKLMHKFGKTIYRRDGIEIRIVPGEDDVKVRIKKPGDDDQGDDASEDGAEASGDDHLEIGEAESESAGE